MPAKVAILGSLNMDLVTAVRHLPAAGETVMASTLTVWRGGKGANQTLAAARALPNGLGFATVSTSRKGFVSFIGS